MTNMMAMVIKSDDRNGGRLKESRHYSYTTGGLVRDQGGRTMVCFSHTVVMIVMVMSMIMDDYDNYDAGDREKKFRRVDFKDGQHPYQSPAQRSYE